MADAIVEYCGSNVTKCVIEVEEWYVVYDCINYVIYYYVIRREIDYFVREGSVINGGGYGDSASCGWCCWRGCSDVFDFRDLPPVFCGVVLLLLVLLRGLWVGLSWVLSCGGWLVGIWGLRIRGVAVGSVSRDLLRSGCISGGRVSAALCLSFLLKGPVLVRKPPNIKGARLTGMITGACGESFFEVRYCRNVAFRRVINR